MKESPSEDVIQGVRHGGDIDAARRRFGEPADGWLDLSTGISPWPYPFTTPDSRAWTELPGSDHLDCLRAAAAHRYGAPDKTCITAVPGTQAILQLLPRLRPRCQVAVVGPTYGEHVATWTAAGHDVHEISAPEVGCDGVDVLVVTNPNNPDGRTISRERLSIMAESLARRGGWLVVDEAFADVAPEISMAEICEKPGLIVLRSFGKFHGLAGLRLGFALTAPSLARSFASALGPWALGGPALAVGREALADDAWHQETRLRLTAGAKSLDEVLTKARFPIVGGTDLFRLAECPDAAAVHDRLGRAGILVRDFQDDPHRLRFGLPPDEVALDRLASALMDRSES